MHNLDTILRVLNEELEYQKLKHPSDQGKDILDFIVLMLVNLMEARNHATKDSFGHDMKAIDEVRKVVALGITMMQTLGYTRRYNEKPELL